MRVLSNSSSEIKAESGGGMYPTGTGGGTISGGGDGGSTLGW